MDFQPVPWAPPANPGLRGRYDANRRMAGAELWDAGGEGPEDIVVDNEGRVYSGLLDGRIVRFGPDGSGPEVIARTGGRPLGLELATWGGLIVCDVGRGLLHVSEAGRIDVLVDSFEGARFLFTNNAAVASDGTIYFTDSSRRYGVERYRLDLLEHSGTGRLFAYRPDGRTVLLLDDLHFANGVALSPDEDFLVVAETGRYSISKLWLDGPKAGQREVFVDGLPAFPDNISRYGDIFWVALPSPRDKLLDAMLPRPWTRRIVARLPEALQPSPARHGLVWGFDLEGALRHNFQDSTGRVAITTGARQHGDRLYVGSLSEPTIAVLELDRLA